MAGLSVGRGLGLPAVRLVSAIGSIGCCSDEPTSPGALSRRSNSVLTGTAARCIPDGPVDDRMGLQTRRLVALPAPVATNCQGGEDGQNSDAPQEGPGEVGGDRTALGQ